MTVRIDDRQIRLQRRLAWSLRTPIRRLAQAIGEPLRSSSQRRRKRRFVPSATPRVLEALLWTPAASAVEERLFDPGDTLHAPHLIDIEVAQVLRRYTATGQIEPERCRDAF
jgi:hypothetical protein